jgi:hypothetical protein
MGSNRAGGRDTRLVCIVIFDGGAYSEQSGSGAADGERGRAAAAGTAEQGGTVLGGATAGAAAGGSAITSFSQMTRLERGEYACRIAVVNSDPSTGRHSDGNGWVVSIANGAAAAQYLVVATAIYYLVD